MQAHAVFNLLYTFALVAATVAIHATGIIGPRLELDPPRNPGQSAVQILAQPWFVHRRNRGAHRVAPHRNRVVESVLRIVRVFPRSVDGVLLFADDLYDPGIR